MISKVKNVMTMTPEEEFNQEVWDVLQKVKRELLATEKGKSVAYPFPTRHFAGMGIISQERQKKLLNKLHEWGALKIRENPWEYPASTDTLFYLDIVQPKFDETYKKFQKACDVNHYLNDYQQKILNKDETPTFSQVNQEEEKIDKWLESKDKWTLQKMWQVVSALNSEWQLRDEDEFGIPHDKFIRAKVENVKDLEAILITLHKHLFITVLRKVSQTPRLSSSDKPQGSLWITILEKPLIVSAPDTQVRIKSERFTYLKNALMKRLSEPQVKSALTNNVPQKAEASAWSDDFRWEGNTFVFGAYGRVNFNSKPRMSLFRLLTDAQGNWVTVRKLKEATGKTETYVRPTVGQIERSMLPKLKVNISIPSTEADNLHPKPQEGAYRIKYTPKSL